MLPPIAAPHARPCPRTDTLTIAAEGDTLVTVSREHLRGLVKFAAEVLGDMSRDDDDALTGLGMSSEHLVTGALILAAIDR